MPVTGIRVRVFGCSTLRLLLLLINSVYSLFSVLFLAIKYLSEGVKAGCSRGLFGLDARSRLNPFFFVNDAARILLTSLWRYFRTLVSARNVAMLAVP